MLTLTDLFCGAGGSSTGAVDVPGVQVRMAANHWQLAVDTHNTNHPDTDHACADLHQEDPSYFPRTDLLWASPECTKWSQANGGRALPAIEEGLFEDPLSDEAAQRSRLLMFDVLRFAEHHRYRAMIVENVVDIATQPKYALAWHTWRQELSKLGYQYRVVSLNSMHAQAHGAPAPQSRDRIYIVCWREGQNAPDLDRVLRPSAYCPACDEVVAARQSWKPNRTVGRYRQQYVYRCPHAKCHNTIVEPGWLPASTAIDWTLPGQRIGDRAKPLAEKTRRRIAAGIARYWRPLHLEAAGHTYDAADPKHVSYGDPNGYYRAWPVDEPIKSVHTTLSKALVVPLRTHGTASSVNEPTKTMVAGNVGHALVAPTAMLVPAGGTWNDDARPVTDPLRTRTTRETEAVVTAQPFIAELRGGGSTARPADHPLATVTAAGNHHALITPYYGNSTPKSVDDALPTVTAVDRHALVMRNNTARGDQGQMSTPVHEPLRTITTAGHQSLLSPGDLAAAEAQVDDVLFRMLEPAEVIAAMAFPQTYVVLGNRREQVRMAGNAVTPPAARDLVAAVVASLTDSPPTSRRSA